MKLLALFISLFLYLTSMGQNTALGDWQVHQPFNALVDVAIEHGKVLGTSELNLFSIDAQDGTVTRFSKSTGLSESTVTASAYDTLINRLVIGYQNGNIDIIYPSRVVNISDLKNKSVIGDKSINQIIIQDNVAWLSTGLGIFTVDLDNESITNNFTLGNGGSSLKINGLYYTDTAILAATPQGLRVGKIDENINLADFNNWKVYNPLSNSLPIADYKFITSFNDAYYIATETAIYRLSEEESEWGIFYNSSKTINFLGSNSNRLFFIELANDASYTISALNKQGSLISKNTILNISKPNAVVQDNQGIIWVADYVNGIIKLNSNLDYLANYSPNGPVSPFVKGMKYYNGKIFAAASEIALNYTSTFSEPRINIAEKFNWKTIDENNLPSLAGLTDILDLEFIADKNILVGISHTGGIFEMDLNTQQILKKINKNDVGDNLRLTAITTDLNGNIWITNSFASITTLICRKKDGTYIYFKNHPKLNSLKNSILTDILADDQNNIWISTSSQGIMVLNTNGTIENFSDDNTDFVLELPNQSVQSIAKDLEGNIWIGTQDGIVVVYCSSGILDRTCGASQICVPRNDGSNFCDNLLNGEFVTAIHVDSGNRKWIGTKNGVFLVNETGLESIYSFNESNSPLLSNVIRSIAIDEKTGDVYFGTEKGIISFRAEATSTNEESEKPIVIPNPVRPDYYGPIAIRNLPNNSVVKILDAAGYLVWEGVSTGGQAIWDGKNGNGEDVKSGIYFVLASSPNGKEKARTKIAIIR